MDARDTLPSDPDLNFDGGSEDAQTNVRREFMSAIATAKGGLNLILSHIDPAEQDPEVLKIKRTVAGWLETLSFPDVSQDGPTDHSGNDLKLGRNLPTTITDYLEKAAHTIADDSRMSATKAKLEELIKTMKQNATLFHTMATKRTYSGEPTHQESSGQGLHREPTHQETTDQETTHQEPTHQEPTHQEPTHQEPTHQEPNRQEPTSSPRLCRPRLRERIRVGASLIEPPYTTSNRQASPGSQHAYRALRQMILISLAMMTAWRQLVFVDDPGT